MKRKLLMIFILLIAVSTLMTGCKKKLEEKIAEKIIEDATGGNVDISKDTTTIKTEQGETKVGENLKWPKDIMGNLPELKANITMVVEDKESTIGMIYFDDLEVKNAENYLEAIIKLNH